jgi:hypothetical protein
MTSLTIAGTRRCCSSLAVTWPSDPGRAQLLSVHRVLRFQVLECGFGVNEKHDSKSGEDGVIAGFKRLRRRVSHAKRDVAIFRVGLSNHDTC